MPEQGSSFIDETGAAARGVFALMVGDRKAPGYFSFTEQGLVGSFIAVLLITALELVAGVAMEATGTIASAAVQTGIVYALFIAGSALFLSLIGRNDALRPYLVTLNWSNAVFSLVLLLLTAIGPTVAGFIALVAGLVMAINIGRLIMSLKPLHIFLLMVTQAVGVTIAVLIVLIIFPPTPEQLAALAAG